MSGMGVSSAEEGKFAPPCFGGAYSVPVPSCCPPSMMPSQSALFWRSLFGSGSFGSRACCISIWCSPISCSGIFGASTCRSGCSGICPSRCSGITPFGYSGICGPTAPESGGPISAGPLVLYLEALRFWGLGFQDRLPGCRQNNRQAFQCMRKRRWEKTDLQ